MSEPAAGEDRRPAPKFVVLYHSSDDVRSKAAVHMPAHAAHFTKYHEAGTLLMIGIFGDPQSQGAMTVLTSREAAEEFAANDPFVVHGVVSSYEIREWHELFVPN